MKIAKQLILVFLSIAAFASMATFDYKSFSGTAEQTKVVADKVLVEKALRRLTLFQNGKSIKTYKVALGKNPVGPKVQKGDGRTPEGIYSIDARNPNSAFHLALHISYPNAADKARAESLGVPSGGGIMIHGIKNWLGWLGSLHRLSDWTQGCIAVTNTEIEEIWKRVPNGTVVEIVP
jgi:murein L,D-transpeptidase YafK